MQIAVVSEVTQAQKNTLWPGSERDVEREERGGHQRQEGRESPAVLFPSRLIS